MRSPTVTQLLTRIQIELSIFQHIAPNSIIIIIWQPPRGFPNDPVQNRILVIFQPDNTQASLCTFWHWQRYTSLEIREILLLFKAMKNCFLYVWICIREVICLFICLFPKSTVYLRFSLDLSNQKHESLGKLCSIPHKTKYFFNIKLTTHGLFLVSYTNQIVVDFN